MSEQNGTPTDEDFISDEELDETYVEPEEGDEETHDEAFLDSLAEVAHPDVEEYIEDDSELIEGDESA